MAMESAPGGVVSSASPARRVLLVVALIVVVAVAALAIAALTLSGVTLASDSSALARVSVGPLGGSVERIEAFAPDGRRVPLSVHDGRMTPLEKLRPGERVSVHVRVRRPGWIGWALGEEKDEQLTVQAPVARVREQWMTVAPGEPVRISFSEPVSAVAYGAGGKLAHRRRAGGARSVSLGRRPATGATRIAAAARPWERVGKPTQVSWFPPSHKAVMATIPAAGSSIEPATPLYLTFSKTVAEALGGARPRVVPATEGHWHEVNSHTLVFKPSGYGAPLGSQLHVLLPRKVAVTAAGGGGLQSATQVGWVVPAGSPLRLQQLLAQEGYLPVVWHTAGTHVAHTAGAEAQAAVEPPAGAFSWRYANTPHQLQALWEVGRENVLTKGAIMRFENNNGLEVDGLAGPTVWRKLMSDAIAGKRLHEGYSYVYVHREVPETMTLWSAGRTVETSPANTGIGGAETELGTFPVFEHIPEGTMSGTNPDGSHYEDPGIKWISYFNGGDALHNFDRASFGTPQSLGCVELPLAASAEIWKYTPIGTVVTVET